MQAMRYSQWQDTAHTLHMILQMMGKVKLKRMPSQPEWNHALLMATASGFTTGLIPDGLNSFEIVFDMHASQVEARCTSGLSAGFPVRGEKSVADYYAAFMGMLAYIGHATRINKIPQEVPNQTPFDKQQERHTYDAGSARNYFDTAIFARNALLTFASPIRSKKIQPQLFWGTFDMTTVLFSGLEKPFPGEGLIERVAFDEQFVEFGYWPGDTVVDEPSFFVLPYPFLTQDLPDEAVSPKEAYYSSAKKEYFLKLSDALAYDDPTEVVRKFCEDAFAMVVKAENWQDVQWFTKPLLC